MIKVIAKIVVGTILMGIIARFLFMYPTNAPLFAPSNEELIQIHCALGPNIVPTHDIKADASLSTILEEPSQIVGLGAHIRSLQPGEEFTILVNTPGGRVDALAELINAMIDTRGIVHLHVTGYADSAGAILCMFAQKVTVSPFTSVLVHLPGYYTLGGQRIVPLADPLSRMISDVVVQRMTKMIGKEKALELYQGKDYMFSGQDFLQLLEQTK